MSGPKAPVSFYINNLDQGWSPKCEPNARTSDGQWAVLKTTSVQPVNYDESENKLLPDHLDPRPAIEVKAGDVLITRAGPRSRVGITCVVRSTQPRLMLADKLYRLKVRRDVADPVWLAQMLNAPQSLTLLEEMKTGISDSGLNLTQEKFLGLPLPLVSLPEQRRIVTKIDSLRARSSRARRELDHIPKLIERYKQAILAKAFSGELTKDWRESNPHDALRFMNTVGVAQAEHRGTDQLPDGWYWAQAGAICSIKSGVALGKKRLQGTELIELPYLRVANVQRGWLNLSEIKTTRVTPREAEALYLQPGDVLMNEGGDRDKLGRGWVWEGEITNCIHQNHVFRLRPRSSQIPSRYISYYANEFGQRYFLDEGKQTTNLASISMSKVSALPIPVCTPAEMAVIVQKIELAFTWLEKIATEHGRAEHLLPKLDQAILAKAFRGELLPQDPNDEPASALLERIKAERTKHEQPTRRRARSA